MSSIFKPIYKGHILEPISKDAGNILERRKDGLYMSNDDSSIKHNYSATAPPTTNDDVNLDYQVGSKWYVVSPLAKTQYICLKNDLNNAVWIQSYHESNKLGEGLISEYTFDDIVGTKLIDNSGSSNDGVMSNVVVSKGIINNAGYFNGTNSVVNFTSPVLPVSTFTISFWLNASSPLGDRSIIATAQDTSQYGVRISYINTSQIAFEVMKGVYGQRSGMVTSNVVNNSIWNHIIITYNHTNNNDAIKIYKNGELEAQSSITNILSKHSSNLIIGKYVTTNNYFAGDLDQVRIWNRVLSDEEITILYNGGMGI